jgi:hypothetical protein
MLIGSIFGIGFSLVLALTAGLISGLLINLTVFLAVALGLIVTGLWGWFFSLDRWVRAYEWLLAKDE